MKSLKTFGLAAMTALVAMALVGATSASATSTSLCKTHTSLTCAAGDQYTSSETVHFVNEGSKTLLNEIQDVLCLSVLANVKVLGSTLANPLALHGSITWSGCGTDSAHDNCTMTEKGGPTKGTLLKTGLDKGLLKKNWALAVRIHLICEDLTIFQIDIDCEYNPSGMELNVGALKVKAEDTPVTADAANSFICPDESSFDGTLKALAATPAHILG